MIRVDVEDIEARLAALAAFNALDLREVSLHETGEPVPTTPADLGEFHFTGLSNKDFVAMRFWERPDPDALRAAARSLAARLRPNPRPDHWLGSVGVRRDELVVLLHRKPPRGVVIPQI